MGKPRITLCLLAAALALLLSACGKGPSIGQYGDRFRFSLEDLRVETLQYDHLSAFQDPWSAFAVRLSGQTEGSDFDPASMTEGVTPRAGDAFRLINADRAAEGEGPFFSARPDGHYRSKVWVRENGSEFFAVILDLDSGIYYCCRCTF